ncbi:MAG: glutamyl-tRNA reductase [Tissierellia bacterium]|nr:glutamyl-tRNA reductase [Tissierellia bacterium]
MVKFCVVGMNHHVAPIEVREKVHFKETDIIEASDILMNNYCQETVILSTCNRSEIYFATEQADVDLHRVHQFFSEYFNVDLPEEYVVEKSGDEAFRHLFYVSMGMDSLVIGEDQILGQVKDAHMTAMEIGSSKKFLNKFFREAITFAKYCKANTSISDHPLSIAYIGVKKADEDLNGLKDKKCMISGLGNMGKLALNHLLEREAKVYVCNRTLENSHRMKWEYPEIEIFPFSELTQGIEEMDLLISATSSPHTIIKKKNIKNRKKPLYIMDLSLPRDVDRDVKDLKLVSLYDIDDLESLAQENLEEKKRILDGFKPMVEDKISELKTWAAESKIDPIMKSLNQRCDDIADDTLNYIFRKTNMTHAEKMKVEKIVRSALKKVLREPILSLKDVENTDKKDAAIELLEEVLG